MTLLSADRRASGIPLRDELPWGSTFCLFYNSRKDLFDLLVPYISAGLESNECCVWVTSDDLREEDATRALGKAIPGCAARAAAGQLEVVSWGRWKARGGKSGKAVLARLDKAIARGFDGLRLACGPVRDRESGKGFIDCGTDAIRGGNVIAAFAYPRRAFDALGLMAAVRSHRFALIRNAGRWEVIESSEARSVKEDLKRSEEQLKSLFDNMSEGFAYHRIVLDAAGRPSDYIFLQVNEAFERLTGLNASGVVGKRATAAVPGIDRDPAGWIEKYGRVALTGEPVRFESFAAPLKRWYLVSAFSPHRGYFAVVFSDITQRKEAEEALRNSLAEKEILLKELAHRTKNNMQVIRSLLSLQASAATDKKLLDAIAETQDRIGAMALVHEKLYRSGQFSALNMKEYVEDLVGSLLRTHQAADGPVRTEIALENIFCSIDAALPCGLIINELVSNSLKHAFAGRRPGAIFISLKRRGEGVELRYRDDGPGLPENLDLGRIKSLGLKLVYNLAVRQLRGAMEIRRDPAPEFVFTFGVAHLETA